MRATTGHDELPPPPPPTPPPWQESRTVVELRGEGDARTAYVPGSPGKRQERRTHLRRSTSFSSFSSSAPPPAVTMTPPVVVVPPTLLPGRNGAASFGMRSSANSEYLLSRPRRARGQKLRHAAPTQPPCSPSPGAGAASQPARHAIRVETPATWTTSSASVYTFLRAPLNRDATQAQARCFKGERPRRPLIEGSPLVGTHCNVDLLPNLPRSYFNKGLHDLGLGLSGPSMPALPCTPSTDFRAA